MRTIRLPATLLSDAMVSTHSATGATNRSRRQWREGRRVATHETSIGLSKDTQRVTHFGENLSNEYAYTGTDSDRSYLRTINGFIVRDYFHGMLRPRAIGLEFSTHF